MVECNASNRDAGGAFPDHCSSARDRRIDGRQEGRSTRTRNIPNEWHAIYRATGLSRSDRGCAHFLPRAHPRTDHRALPRVGWQDFLMAVARTKQLMLLDPQILRQAVRDSFRKLAPRHVAKNPVMFVVEVGSVLTSI